MLSNVCQYHSRHFYRGRSVKNENEDEGSIDRLATDLIIETLTIGRERPVSSLVPPRRFRAAVPLGIPIVSSQLPGKKSIDEEAEKLGRIDTSLALRCSV